jgi:ribosomal protein L19E
MAFPSVSNATIRAASTRQNCLAPDALVKESYVAHKPFKLLMRSTWKKRKSGGKRKGMLEKEKGGRFGRSGKPREH